MKCSLRYSFDLIIFKQVDIRLAKKFSFFPRTQFLVTNLGPYRHYLVNTDTDDFETLKAFETHTVNNK